MCVSELDSVGGYVQKSAQLAAEKKHSLCRSFARKKNIFRINWKIGLNLEEQYTRSSLWRSLEEKRRRFE